MAAAGLQPSHAMEIDSRLQHLKLSCRIIERSHHALGHGGFSEVFRGRCRIESRGELNVAIKRLRFHAGNVNFKNVRLTVGHPLLRC